MRELLRELAARDDDGFRYVLYARRRWAEADLDERFSWHLIPARDPWWHLRTALAANRRCDAFLSSNSYLTAWFLRIPVVPIVYDMIPFDPQMRPNRRSVAIERLTLGLAVRRSAALLCISQATSEALIERFPAAAGKAVVAPLGATLDAAESIDSAELAALPDPGFVLAVGTLEPRKNLPRLVAAYASLDRALQQAHPLAVVGALGWETDETLQALSSLGDRCRVLGYVSDAALAELYRRCAVFCYPSLGEGFGLPILEAMSAGAAVVTSNLSSLPEVGGDAVAYVDPHSVVSIATGMRHVLDDGDYRDDLRRRAIVRATRFSWEGFADQVLDVFAQTSRARL